MQRARLPEKAIPAECSADPLPAALGWLCVCPAAWPTDVGTSVTGNNTGGLPRNSQWKFSKKGRLSLVTQRPAWPGLSSGHTFSASPTLHM